VDSQVKPENDGVLAFEHCGVLGPENDLFLEFGSDYLWAGNDSVPDSGESA